MKTWLKSVRIPLFALQFLSSTTIATPIRSSDSVEHAPLYFEVGEQRALAYPELLRFSMSGDAIRHTRLKESNRILIKAIKPGIAQLEVLEGKKLSEATSSTRLIRVEQRKTLGKQSDLLQALSRLKTLEVIDAGKRFVIRGEVATITEAQVVAELRDQFSEQLADETEIAASWMEKLKPALKTLVAEHPQLQLDLQESSVLIRGSVPHPEILKNLERRVRKLQPLARFDVQTIKDQNATLYFKIYLLEMKRETMRSLGVRWPTEHPMSITTATFDRPGWTLGGPTQVDLSVQAMSEKGELQILSSPELVVRCPGQAELFAGGELPIRQRSKFSDSITWKNIGLSLKLDAKEYSGEKVRLNLETELSHLDGALTHDEIPGVKSNRIKTQVDATMNRPLFLSGLLQDDFRKRIKGLPGLSDIPILGALFGSEDFQNERSELVAILLPSRDPPSQPITRLGLSLPRGFLPLPRSPVAAQQLEEIKSAPDYPWNALE